MTTIPYRTALIVGAGSGISGSVARGLATAGLKVGVAARNVDKLASLAAEIGAERFTVDASDPAAVAHLFEEVDTRPVLTRPCPSTLRAARTSWSGLLSSSRETGSGVLSPRYRLQHR